MSFTSQSSLRTTCTTFLVPAYLGHPGKEAVQQVSVCLSVCLLIMTTDAEYQRQLPTMLMPLVFSSSGDDRGGWILP